MRDNSANRAAFVFASITVVASAVVIALVHRPTRKKIKGGLIDAIDKTDKKLGEFDENTEKLVADTKQKWQGYKKASKKELQKHLNEIQARLDSIE